MSRTASPIAANAPLRVLVVDDNAECAASIAMAIEDFGDDVRSCRNGFDALKIASLFRPDVLLLDLTMPGLDGLAVARRLRENTALAGLKIIAQTASDGGDIRRRTASAGFDLHLVKPISLQMLDDMFSLLRLTPRRMLLS